jgi:hypothetical protein
MDINVINTMTTLQAIDLPYIMKMSILLMIIIKMV